MMMVRKSKGLSERHIKVLELLQTYAEKGIPPSIREIGEGTGISSTSVVNYYLDQLEKWGYIQRDRKISRGLRVIESKLIEAGLMIEEAASKVGEMLSIPVVNMIGASLPLGIGQDFAADGSSVIEVARSMVNSKSTDSLFALEVRGDSMIDAMVNDGDYVIMKRVSDNNEVRNGEMVAIYLPDSQETTLKSFYKEKNGDFRLQPANPTMEPIMIDKATPIEIQGKVVMIFRKFGNNVLH
jgi:repressor LexA